MNATTHAMAWDPDIVPPGSGDPETDATPETLLYIARDVWRLFAPDPDEVAACGRLTRAQRADIAFWLGPLESLVRAILFLLLPRDLRARRAEAVDETPCEAGHAAAPTPNTPPNTPPPPLNAPSIPLPQPAAPTFRYWTSRTPAPELVFDLVEPEAAIAFAAFLAARDARRLAAARGPLTQDVDALPTARRLIALLDVLNDPLTHVDRLAVLVRRHRPAMQFGAPPRKPVSGPRPPCTHALERARAALCAGLDPLIGPPRPYWSSG